MEIDIEMDKDTEINIDINMDKVRPTWTDNLKKLRALKAISTNKLKIKISVGTLNWLSKSES
jgi:hypothetical protein